MFMDVFQVFFLYHGHTFLLSCWDQLSVYSSAQLSCSFFGMMIPKVEVSRFRLFLCLTRQTVMNTSVAIWLWALHPVVLLFGL